MRVVVVGTGYVGLVQGALLAHLGHEVVCVDVDLERLARLEAGEVPFFEPGLDEYVREGMEAGQLTFTNDLQAACKGAAVIFICVGTPQTDSGAADLSAVESVANALHDCAEPSALVVTKSTVPVGTSKKIRTWIDRSDVDVASNPEFLREGKAVEDFLHPSRIVFGVREKIAEETLRALYRGIEAPTFVMSPESAELSKYAANTMLASRLSLMNEIAGIADATGADIVDIERVVGSDPRIGSAFLRSGAGFGGSCFPKDVLALEHVAREYGYEPRLVAPIIDVNHAQAKKFVEKIEARLGSLAGKRLAVWGLAFKEGTDDVRESPALRILEHLLWHGAHVVAHDPRAHEGARAHFGDRIVLVESAHDALKGAEALLLLTAWPEFVATDWAQVKGKLETAILFDARNVLSAEELAHSGFEVICLGRPPYGPAKNLDA